MRFGIFIVYKEQCQYVNGWMVFSWGKLWFPGGWKLIGHSTMDRLLYGQKTIHGLPKYNLGKIMSRIAYSGLQVLKGLRAVANETREKGSSRNSIGW